MIKTLAYKQFIHMVSYVKAIKVWGEEEALINVGALTNLISVCGGGRLLSL